MWEEASFDKRRKQNNITPNRTKTLLSDTLWKGLVQLHHIYSHNQPTYCISSGLALQRWEEARRYLPGCPRAPSTLLLSLPLPLWENAGEDTWQKKRKASHGDLDVKRRPDFTRRNKQKKPCQKKFKLKTRKHEKPRTLKKTGNCTMPQLRLPNRWSQEDKRSAAKVARDTRAQLPTKPLRELQRRSANGKTTMVWHSELKI